MELNGIDRCLECMQDKGGAATCPHCGTAEPLPPRPPPYLPYGTRLNDQFVIGRMLGHGGFGVTYLAWDTRLETRVAIKEYLPRDCSTRSGDGLSVSCFQGEATEMFAYGKGKFLEEARNLARFPDHPGIVKVLGYFEANGTAYMVMPYLEGMDLKQFLAQAGGRLPVETALGIMTPVLDALRAVHEVGLLHRDMSPDNIYITSTQRVLILDFGAARDAMGSHSRSLALIRKPGYSPEEQYRLKGEQGPWTDVYAAGATLYRMVTGEVPPEALDRLAGDHLQPPSRLGVAMEPEREAALLKALAVRAADRFQDIRAFQDAILGGAPAQPQPQVVPSAPTLPITPVSQSGGQAGAGSAQRWWIASLILVVIGTIATGGWLWHQQSLEQARRTLIEQQREREAARQREAERLESARLEAERRRQDDALRQEDERREADRLEATRRNVQREQALAAERRRQSESTSADLFRAKYSSDGFVALRSGPTTSATMVARIPGGTRLYCESTTNGAGWRHCPQAGGWVYAKLLIPTVDDSAYTDSYRVVHTSDGFVAVRTQPTTRSGKLVAKLHAGDRVHCDRSTSGQRFSSGDRWLHCPDAGGWIYSGLLQAQ